MENPPPQYIQQQQPQQQLQQPTDVMAPPQVTRDQFKQSSLSQMKVLSILQVVIGGLCIIFGAALTGLISERDFYSGYYGSVAGYVGAGIWIGAYYIIVGGIGIGAVRWNSACWIISTMVLNIIGSSLFCCVLVYLAAGGISTGALSRRYNDYESNNELITADLTLNCFLLLLGIAEFILTIWSAVLCCGAVCRCCKPSQMSPQYYPTQQPMMYGGGPGVVAYHVGQPIAVQGQYSQPMAAQVQYAQPMAAQVQPPVQVQPQRTTS